MKKDITAWNYKSRYVRVTVRMNRTKTYPNCATEIIFTLPRMHAVDAVKTLMCWMGYKVTQYYIVSADEVSQRKMTNKSQGV